jgi:hypothetical protein
MLVVGSVDPPSLAIDATSAYYATAETSNGMGRLARVPLGGGAVQELAPLDDLIGAIAVDGTSAYWSTVQFYSSSGSVTKTPLAGGARLSLASFKYTGAYGLAVDGTSAFFTFSSDSQSGLAKVSLDGGRAATLATKGDNLSNVVVARGSVYWTDFESVLRIPAEGGAVSTLASGRLPHLAVRSTNICWTLPQGGVVRRMGICDAGVCR